MLFSLFDMSKDISDGLYVYSYARKDCLLLNMSPSKQSQPESYQAMPSEIKSKSKTVDVTEFTMRLAKQYLNEIHFQLMNRHWIPIGVGYIHSCTLYTVHILYSRRL